MKDGELPAGPERAGDVAKRFLRKIGLHGSLANARINTAWNMAAGEELAGHTRVIRLRNNVLLVEVDSSTLLGELRGFMKQELLERVRENTKGMTVLDLDFKVGRFQRERQ
jgi:predicted nucleic acid-binding Zn ribbon protein